MKTKFILPVIAIVIITASAFFIYISYITNPLLQHHDEVNPPRPDDRFRTEGMKWEWNDYIYGINEKINFTVSRHADNCGDVFTAKIMNPDWSEVYWQESAKSRCEVDYEDLVNNEDFEVLVAADFPSNGSITLSEEGLYVLRVVSQDRGYGALEGQFLVKNKKDDSELSKINTNCMTIEQSKQIASFFKIPTYLPEDYSYICSRSGMPFESYIVYYYQEFPPNWQIHELVNSDAIFIYQIDERNLVGEKEFQTYGSPEQRIQETYDGVMKGNPSLNPQLITINGMLAYAVDSCPNCGIQTANFTDGTSIQEITATTTKIKFIDEKGVKYMLETTLPLSELIKVAESLE